MAHAEPDTNVTTMHVLRELPVSAGDAPTRATGPLGLASDATMRAIVDASPDCIKIVEIDGTISFINAGGCLAMEIADRSALAGQRWETLWPASSLREAEAALEAARGGRTANFEAHCITPKGSTRWWDVSVAPIAGTTSVVAIARDVTERVNRENQLRLQEIELNQLASEQADRLRLQQDSMDASDVLLREVDHRMKNSLAMLGSLLKMETRRVSDEGARAILKAAAARVATIASVHEQLYRGTEKDAVALDTYLSALVRDLTSSMVAGPAGPVIEAHVEADPVTLRGGLALALGLATVEMVMNAIRHGQGRDGCRIEVTCRRTDDAMRLTVRDRGPGLPPDFDPATSRGLGMRVVQSSMAKLGGDLTWRNGADGGAEFVMVWEL